MSIWRRVANEGVRSVVESLSNAPELTERYAAHNYHPLPVTLVRACGARVWDSDGKEYVDGIGAYSATAHGHLAPAVVKALQDQLEALALASRATYTPELALFSKLLCEYAELDMLCPMCTGSEAVETCIKLARKWAYQIKGVPNDRAEILVCEGNFHGRTTTIVGFSSEPGYREGFGPFAPGFRSVPFGDLEAMKQAVHENTAAILVEPIQAEGGVLVPSEGYLKGLRQLCDDAGILLVFDEVQTGFCRTGAKFAWMHEGAVPDLMSVGKPLGGGLLPVSAAIGKEAVMRVFEPGDHGSTFGGSSLSCAVAIAAMAEMEVRDFAGMARAKGERFMTRLRQADAPAVLEVRGKGLLIGVEVRPEVDTKRLGAAFLEQGLLTKETRRRTFRFTPPITIEDDLLDEAAERAIRALRSAVD